MIGAMHTPGNTQLIVLPGLDGTGKRLLDFTSRLPSALGTTIIRYPTDEPLGYGELDLRVAACLPRDRPFVLLAESFSGPILVRIAARAPPGLRAVVLCASFAASPHPWLRWVRPLAVRAPLKSMPAWLRRRVLWNKADPRRLAPARERAIAAVAPAVLRTRIGAVIGVDDRHLLPAIHVPALILRARADRIVPAAATRQLAAALPRAQVVEIDGPHLILQTRAAESAAAVGAFLRDLERDARR